MMIPNICENNTCSKPPTRYEYGSDVDSYDAAVDDEGDDAILDDAAAEQYQYTSIFVNIHQYSSIFIFKILMMNMYCMTNSSSIKFIISYGSMATGYFNHPVISSAPGRSLFSFSACWEEAPGQSWTNLLYFNRRHGYQWLIFGKSMVNLWC